MPVFTILNCGTKFDRRKTGELIADFGNNMRGQEHVDYLINEGPGGSAQGHLMPGTFDPFTKDRTAKKDSPKWSQTPMQTLLDVKQGETKYQPDGHGFLTGVTTNTSSANAAITGHGWDDNIRHAIATLADRFPDLTATVNMIGWSRGAVTCLRLANWMKEFLGSNWTVNIFAVDPVAGIDAGAKLRDTYEIPDIVKDFVGILAMDEARGDFRPQDLSRLQILDRTKTAVSLLPFPGVHNTVVVNKDSSLPEVTSAVRYLGYKFLSDRGTVFRAPEAVYSQPQLCRLYALMQKKRTGYRSLMNTGFVSGLAGGITPRSTVQMSASIHPFFVNEHHRVAFKATYPDIYNYFFTTQVPNPFGKVTTSYRASDPWGRNFQQFYQSAPDSFEVLSKFLVAERQGGMGSPAVWKVSAPGSGAAPLSASAASGLSLVTTLI
ncbi:MAG TPA: DUF5621 domain-containing protein [Bryobacteraceae bacterium]|nr:DUF5621 domain-containing protein [Bryobacteraceae bacterium]